MSVNLEAATAALIAHLKHSGRAEVDLEHYDKPLDDQLTDLVVDVCALARTNGFNFQDILNRAEDILEYEVR